MACSTIDYTAQNVPNEPEAILMLRRSAYIVSRIMVKHTGPIHLLAEFYHDRSSLGDMRKIKTTGICNRIRLRLRRHKFPGIFLPMETVVQTLLHELAHIQFKDHGLDFFRWNVELLIELDEAVEKGEVRREEIPTRATNERETRILEQLETMTAAKGGTADLASLGEQMAMCTISE